jgi:hypothetical protein
MSQILPLDSSPNQTFTSTLMIDGNNVTMRFELSFNEVAGYWVMNMINPTTGEYILASVPLLPSPMGTLWNILGQFAHLGLGSLYLVNVSNNDDATPSESNLGTDFVLVWGDTDV